MRIVILSTPTPHHTYFINRIAAEFPVVGVVYEMVHAAFPFDTDAPYAAEEHAFEDTMFFRDVLRTLPLELPVASVPTVNDFAFAHTITPMRPDLALVFGCGRIRPHVFRHFPRGMLNVHRGIASAYRGLDCDLWPIYHNDLESIGVTIHAVAPKLDTGDVYAVDRVALGHEDRIAHLRYATTILATDAMRSVLASFAANRVHGVPQETFGRYYSAMPAVLKAVCAAKFERAIAQHLPAPAAVPA